MVIIIIASVSTVSLLVVLTSYYYQYQYRSAVLENNHLVRFNVTNDTDKLGFLKFILPPKMGKHGFLILPIQMMANSIRTVQKYQEIQMEVGM